MRTTLMLGLVLAAACGGCAWGQPTTAPGGSPPGRARERGPDGAVPGPTRAGWWNDAVFYEVFVRSFKDSSAGPLAGDGIGDIAGLIEKLDYLNDGDPATTTDLGVTGLWLMPIHPSPSYHGYDVTDYRGVNPQYGTLDDFRRLVGACHKRGIRVILDLVLNHCSDQNPWFAGAADAASPKHDWFIWADADPGWKGPWNERVWHPAREGKSWYYGIFSGRMPDLNYRNAQVSAEMLDVTDFWVDKEHGIGADGYRLDAVRHLVEDGRMQENTPETHAWLRKFHEGLKRANPEAMSIGEVWTGSEMAATYVGNELDMTFEFELAGAMVEAARTGKAAPVVEAQKKVLRCYPPNQYGRFLTNHDQTRVMTALKGDMGKMRAAAAMLLLGPGVPFIYYGEEIGMTGDKPDENLRTPMQWSADATAGFTSGTPWEPAHADRVRVNVEAERGDEGSLLGWYRTLIALRAEHSALAHGSYAEVRCGNPGVFAFVRGGDAPVMVIINLGDAPVREYTLDVAGVPPRENWSNREALHAGPLGASMARPIEQLGSHEAYVLTTKVREASEQPSKSR